MNIHGIYTTCMHKKPLDIAFVVNLKIFQQMHYDDFLTIFNTNINDYLY